MRKKGFTLIELMVVIAIIAVLGAIMAPQIFRQIAKGRVGAAESFHNTVKVGATSYFSDLGIWPATCTGITGAANNCNTLTGANGGFIAAPTAVNADWDGPYIDRWPSAAAGQPGANPWRGNYNWTSANGIVFNAAGAAVGERYLTLTIVGVNGIPTADAQRLDLDIDRVAGSNTGIVRALGNPAAWPAAGNVTTLILVSRDGPVN